MPRSTLIIGVDPGGRGTGIVVRDRDELIAHTLATRPAADHDARPGADYIRAIIHWTRTYADAANAIVAVEDVTAPTGWSGGEKRPINPGSLIGVAMVFGAILGAFPDAVIVHAAHHGQAPIGAYPERLRPTRGKGKGSDRLRHCRSAWDVAGAADSQMKLARALGNK